MRRRGCDCVRLCQILVFLTARVQTGYYSGRDSINGRDSLSSASRGTRKTEFKLAVTTRDEKGVK